MKICADCKHYVDDDWGAAGWPTSALGNCTVLKTKVHPVSGAELPDCHVKAEMMRLTLCGWDFPRFWEPKK